MSQIKLGTSEVKTGVKQHSITGALFDISEGAVTQAFFHVPSGQKARVTKLVFSVTETLAADSTFDIGAVVPGTGTDVDFFEADRTVHGDLTRVLDNTGEVTRAAATDVVAGDIVEHDVNVLVAANHTFLLQFDDVGTSGGVFYPTVIYEFEDE